MRIHNRSLENAVFPSISLDDLEEKEEDTIYNHKYSTCRMAEEWLYMSKLHDHFCCKRRMRYE